MVKTKKVKLGVTGLLSFQHDLKLSPLLTHEAGRPLDDIMGLNCCWLRKKGKEDLFILRSWKE